MKRFAFAASAICLLILACSISTAGPEGGTYAGFAKIQPHAPYVFTNRFIGRQRASVIVRGDHQPFMDIHIKVFDAKGNLVTQDVQGGDVVGVIWYPPQTAEYRIEITILGSIWNNCYISVR